MDVRNLILVYWCSIQGRSKMSQSGHFWDIRKKARGPEGQKSGRKKSGRPEDRKARSPESV